MADFENYETCSHKTVVFVFALKRHNEEKITKTLAHPQECVSILIYR